MLIDCDQKIKNLLSLNLQGITDAKDEQFIRDHCRQAFCDFLVDGMREVSKDLQNPNPNLQNMSILGRVTGTFVDRSNVTKSMNLMNGKINTFCHK